MSVARAQLHDGVPSVTASLVATLLPSMAWHPSKHNTGVILIQEGQLADNLSCDWMVRHVTLYGTSGIHTNQKMSLVLTINIEKCLICCT